MPDFDKAKNLWEQPPESLLALTLWGEARGEKAMGKRAVAWVVRNRMAKAAAWKATHGRNHPLFGDGSVSGAVLRPWQFSCWNKGDPNLAKMLDIIHTDGEAAGAGLWAILKAVARGVLAEPPEWPDPTWGATHYCTVDLWGEDREGAWYGEAEIAAGRTKETVTIGDHVFARVA